MSYSSLLAHLDRFTSGGDRSVQWAKEAEALLDSLEQWDGVLDELQEYLSLYRPGGGPHLIDEDVMARYLERVIAVLRPRSNPEEF